MTTELKIFEIRWTKQGEKDWVCANTNIHALMCYLNNNSMSLNDLDEADEIVEIPKEKWAELFIVNTEYDENDPEDWERQSFEDYMKEQTAPDIIATTIV